MCASDGRKPARFTLGQGGLCAPESLVGAALALTALLAALAASRGLLRLGEAIQSAAERATAAHWALGRLTREAARAGLGVCPERLASCPDEAVEFADANAIALRGDLDGDDPTRAFWPEQLLVGAFPQVATGNDEVVVYLVRSEASGATRRIEFEADLDSSDRVVLADGTEIARRDGRVETIDAGPAAAEESVEAGTLHRVTFIHDARRFGTGRFRVVEPLVDNVTRFRVEGRDGADRRLPACGGADDAAGRACRSALRRVVLELDVVDAAGRAVAQRREVRLAAAGWTAP